MALTTNHRKIAASAGGCRISDIKDVTACKIPDHGSKGKQSFIPPIPHVS